MGVAGLWEVLRPAGQVRSLTEIAVEDGFNANPSCQRGFRIGIDASIWFFHATYGREGENPELRTLFFRCCRLLQLPFLPLFVFDGPNRPAIKRGKRVGANAHWLTQGMKNIIDGFGFEWWIAPGEAEAELAYLNRVGIIDAVLSDDVDNFLFGATMVIRNPSNTLSGNRAHPVKNAQGKDDGNHVVTYTTEAILSDSSVALSRSGTILIGLLSGGDYIPAGLPGCGQKFATGLARAGFGDSLLKAVKDYRGAKLDAFLDEWRQDLRSELKTNKNGFLPSKKPSLAASLPDDFPSLPVLMSYVDPLTSENPLQKGKRKALPGEWRNDPDPMRIASLCELYFEWGVKDVIVHRFRTVLWPGIVCRAVRRSVVDDDIRRLPTPDGSRRLDSKEGDIDGPPSPTKRISSTLSVLTLESPSKKSAANTSTCISSGSESFTLSSLVTLTAPASSSSSCPTTPSSPRLPDSSPSPLLLEVLSQRAHTSTDSTLEYRVLIDPTTLVERAENGVKGLRPPLIGGLFGIDPEDEEGSEPCQDADESGSGSDDGIERLETAAGAASKSGVKRRKARQEVPTAPLRLWLPACMVRAAAPALVEAYEEKARVREERKAKRGTKGGRGGRARTEIKSTSKRTKGKDVADDDDNLSVPGPSATKTAVVPKIKPKAVGIGGRRRKPKQASEAQNDAYEYFDLSAGESPCSSDGDGDDLGKVGVKAKTRQTGVTKPAAKTSTKTDTTRRRAPTTSTMKEFFNTKKPSTMKAIGSKSSTSQPLVAKLPKLNSTTSKRVYGKEGEEESTDTDIPPPLPRSSRPLEVLRAKSKGTTVPSKPTFIPKPTAVPRCEEEESSSSSPYLPLSGSKPITLSLPCRPIQQAPPAKKSSLFVDVSDTDSDIAVSDIQRPLFGTRATTVMHKEAGSGAASLEDENADSDTIEIVDVFTALRAGESSLVCSPIPSSSLVKPPFDHTPARPIAFVKSKQSDGCPTNPTKFIPRTSVDSAVEPHDTTNPRRRVSLDAETCASGNERNSILKSPRKSATHSSPRHVSRTHGPVLPLQKPRPSDASVICISSGSEDEHSAKLSIRGSRARGDVEVNEDRDEWTDWDVDEWADTGMIMSALPTPVRVHPASATDFASCVPAAEDIQKSRFKPAPVALKANARAPSAESEASGRTTTTSLKNTRDNINTIAPHPMHHAPLLAARAKRSKGEDDDIIDLTSD